MTSLMIDTGAFVAQRIPGDQYHALATSAFAELADSSVRLFSTEHILDETVTMLKDAPDADCFPEIADAFSREQLLFPQGAEIPRPYANTGANSAMKP